MSQGIEKVAIILSALGDRAETLMEQLDDADQERIQSQMNAGVDDSELPELINEIINELEIPVPDFDPDADEAPELSIDLDEDPVSEDLFSDDEPEEATEESDAIATELESDEIEEDAEELDMQDYTEIAELISEQPPQMIAFIMSRLSPEINEKISEKLSHSTLTSIEGLSVEELPISETVYKMVYESIFGTTDSI